MAALIGLDSTSSGFDPGLQDPPITFGVWGDSGDADGVIGSSNTGVGVFGRSIAAAAAAVRGSSQNGTGVQATSAGGSALHARRDPGGGAAVTEAFLATPSLAADFRGDVATSGAVRVGGRLEAAGVIGSSDTGVGVLGRSIDAAAAAVRGSSQNGTGVEATSARGSALHARRDPGGGAAVTEAFLATPSLAADFRGDVATSGAVRVGGRLEAAGVIGSSDTGVGVLGRSIDAAAAAVRGSSQNGTGVDATSARGSALHARRDPGGGAAVTEAFLATPSLAADFRGDVATSGAVRVGGRLGVGSMAPRAAVGIRGVGADEELLSFEDSSGVTRWHVNQKLAGRSGLNFAETDVAGGNGRLYLQAGGNVGVGTTEPTHPLHVAKVRGIRQNELYLGSGLSGARGWSSLSYNAYHDDSNTKWVFPDPSRRAVTIEMDDTSGGNPRFEVYCTTREAPETFAQRFSIEGQSGLVRIPNGQLNVFNGHPAVAGIGNAVHAISDKGVAVFAQGPEAVHAFGKSTFNGDVHVNGRLFKSSPQFKIDHPLDPENKFLHHSGVESDEMKNIYDGVADLDADGRAAVVLPDWFEALNETFRYQLTSIGAAAPDLHIAAELRDARFAIAGGHPNTKVCWQVSGVRHDAYAQAHPLQVEALKAPEEAGLFLHAEEHDQPAGRSLATLFTAPANGSGQG